MNDFAWATAKKFVWTATRATIPTKGPVPIHMVFLPGRANLFRDAGQISRHALEFYSKLWAPYPFPQLTLQDGPSAGMEYPMVINSNSGAADHEAGHQWWPMMVGNNETWYGWMDEGFNQYMNILSDADYARQKPVLDGEGQSYGRSSGDEWEAADDVERQLGGPDVRLPDVFQDAAHAVDARRHRRRQRGAEGAQRVHARVGVQASVAVGLHVLHEQPVPAGPRLVLVLLAVYDRTCGRIASQSVTTSAGKTTVTVRQDGQMPSPVVLRVEFEPTGAPIRMMPNAKAEGTNAAIVTWPVNVWFNGSKTFVAALDFGGRAIRKITLDPFGRFPDKDATDNVWPR